MATFSPLPGKVAPHSHDVLLLHYHSWLAALVMFLDAGCVSLELEKVTCPVCWPWFIIKTAHQFQPCWSAYVQSHMYCFETVRQTSDTHTHMLMVESEHSFDNSHALLWFSVCCHHCHTLCWRNTKPDQLCFLHQLSVIRCHYCWPGVLSLQETQHVPTHQGNAD